MSVDDSILLLSGYDAWRIEKLSSTEPDVSPAAYMASRANDDNVRRIADALKAIDGYILSQKQRGDGMDQEAVDELEDIARILVDDREFTINRSLAGQTERIFLT